MIIFKHLPIRGMEQPFDLFFVQVSVLSLAEVAQFYLSHCNPYEPDYGPVHGIKKTSYNSVSPLHDGHSQPAAFPVTLLNESM